MTTTSTVFTAGAAVAQAGSTCSTETLTAGSAAASGLVVPLTISYTTSGVGSQALVLTGTYATLGLAATSFTVPTDANVVWYSIAANTPAVTLGCVGDDSRESHLDHRPVEHSYGGPGRQMVT